MESSFFYYYLNGENGQIHKLSANKAAYKNSVKIGFSVEADIDADEDGTKVIVPETMNGIPVSMFEFGYRSDYCDTFIGETSPIKYIYIPAGVKYLDLCFSKAERFSILNGCTVEISPENPYFCVYNHGIYNKDMTELYYIFSPHNEFIVPNTVKIIKKYAGRALKDLRYLTVTPGVVDIEENAFEGCFELEKAEIHAKNIGKSAFENCPLLQKVQFQSTEIIGDRAFKNCKALMHMIFAHTFREIGDEAFAMTDLSGLDVPAKVTRLGADSISNASTPSWGMSLDIYSEDNRILFPIKDVFRAAPPDSRIIMNRDSDCTILYTLVSPGDFDELFTPFGVDEELYQNQFSKYRNSLGDARDKLHDPSRYELSGDVLELLKLYVSNMSALELMGIIDKGTYERLCEYPYFNDISTQRLTNVSAYSAHKGKTEMTAFLMQKVHERQNTEHANLAQGEF